MISIVEILTKRSVFNNRLVFARSLLATGTLITLLFNDINEMINFDLLVMEKSSFKTTVYFQKYSVFELFEPLYSKVISIVILLFVFTGFFPQISCILQSWIHLSVCNSFLVVDGGDQIASNLSLLLIPICLLDSRINQWKIGRPIVNLRREIINVFCCIYYILISLQVAVIYLHAAIGKLYSEEWRQGTSLYFWLSHNVFGPPIWMQNIYNIVMLSNFVPVVTWFVIIVELGLFAAIVVTEKKIKKCFLFIGLTLHFLIAINHGLLSFFFSMAGALILYLDEENIICNFFVFKFKRNGKE